LDLGYTWSPVGESTWVASTSPGHSARINDYGAYNFTDGQCFVWHNGICNSDNTIGFLQQLAQWLDETERQVVLIWDGASLIRNKLSLGSGPNLTLIPKSKNSGSHLDFSIVERYANYDGLELASYSCN